MLVHSHFQENDLARIALAIDAMPLAQLISISAVGALSLNPIPLLIEKKQSPNFVFVGHMSKANQQWVHFKERPQVHGSFQGPSAYISPVWYKENLKQQVPTWNYTFIEFKGRVELIEDTTSLISLLTNMANAFEKRNQTNWEFDIPTDLQGELLANSIVGIRIFVEHLEAKFKLSQNRTTDERKKVIDELEQSKWQPQSVADIMKTML